MPGLEIQALYGYRACNIFSFKGMKEIKRFNPEVIHVQTEFGIGIFGRIAAEYLDIPVVYTYHTMWTDYSHYINPINSENSRYCRQKSNYKKLVNFMEIVVKD